MFISKKKLLKRIESLEGTVLELTKQVKALDSKRPVLLTSAAKSYGSRGKKIIQQKDT